MTASKKSPPTLSTFAPAELAIYHKNPRIGNVAVIEGSLKTNDQYKPILVNRGTHTGRPHEVLAGNHTLMAIRNLSEKFPDDPRWSQVLAYVIDVDEDRATRIVLADNRTSELGQMDETLLFDLVSELDDLDGTGYDEDEVNRLAELNRLFSGPADGEGALDHDVDGGGKDVTIELGKVPAECAEVGLTVGVVRVKVPRAVYEQWFDDLRENTSYESKDQQDEVLRRLGLA